MSKVSRLIRLSKAKTAYGLLRDVQKAIIEEPRRANMGVYTCKLNPDTDPYAPACGTVGCVAGWISLLSGQGRVDDDIPARKLLDPKGDVLDLNTVGPYRNYVFNGGEGDACNRTTPGTPEHAGAVVQRIETFIQRNLKALKARRLPSLSTRRRLAQGYR